MPVQHDDDWYDPDPPPKPRWKDQLADMADSFPGGPVIFWPFMLILLISLPFMVIDLLVIIANALQ